MFQCFLVEWDNGDKEHMSPWDFEPIDIERMPNEVGGSVDIMPEERKDMMYKAESHGEWSEYGRDHDCDRISRGLAKIMELSIAGPFMLKVDLNLIPSYAIVMEYPIDLGTIKARVQNHYYRRLDAVKFDVRYIALNAQKFNETGSFIAKQAKSVEELCIKFIESSDCADPMIIYHEMTEAKQSKSQESQSKLYVLCSKSDSDGAQNTQKRLKRKKVDEEKLPERFHPSHSLIDVMPHISPYVPQIGYEIVYFRQGHELYVQAVKRYRIYDIFMKNQPWKKINLRDTEVARIEDITFENHAPRLCCLKLVLLYPASQQRDTFTVKYHDMTDVVDFIVLRQNYNKAMDCKWKPGDRFLSAIDKTWWHGIIKSQKPLNPHFPDSMFQCFFVKWDNGEKDRMNPWDLERIDNERIPAAVGDSVDISPEEMQDMMYIAERGEWSKYGRDHDCDRISRGLARIMELSIAEPFIYSVDLNLHPSYAIVVEYPVDLLTIKARVQNHYYRRLDAVKFDVRYIALNARKFNEPGSRLVKQAKCVEELCIKFIHSSHCADPMIIYHEMMEAKHSMSQDSQSELDVLCSESDSYCDQNTPKRLKRNKVKFNSHVTCIEYSD